MKALRQTVDLSAYPDLVVVYLGMTVNALTGVKTLLGFGPKIEGSVAARPDGLLLHENIFYSLFPLHLGMRLGFISRDCPLGVICANVKSVNWLKSLGMDYSSHRLGRAEAFSI